MLLTKLLPQNIQRHSAFNPDITGITSDSRTVEEGFAFVALIGAKTDGSQFILAAIKAGARAIITEPAILFPHDPSQIVHITTDNPRLLLSLMAARFYAPAPEVVAAVTGTNGKTSVAHFCRMIWQNLGLESASIGTIGIIDRHNSFAKDNGTPLTTPDPVALHSVLGKLAQNHIQHVAMEASSHGLDQYRLDGVTIKAAGFTNLTRDHLDYHHSYENYLHAKMGLFDRILPEEGIAVLNADIPEYGELVALCRKKRHAILSYGWQGEGLRLLSITPTVTGQHITFLVFGKEYRVQLELVGEFQTMNILCALGLVIACGADSERAVMTLESLPSVPGRMEKVPIASRDKAIFVDYAHTPDALEKALQALRPHSQSRLIVVFGCGGDRDKGKRPQMGAIAARLADMAIVTDDNPRTEDAGTIRKEVLVGCSNGIEIADRAEAIGYAIAQMQPGDIVLIAGKGHEKTQITHNRIIPFDDLAVAVQKAGE